MAWRHLILQLSRYQSEYGQIKSLFVRTYLCVSKFKGRAGNRFLCTQERFRSSYVENLARRVRDADEASDAARLKELYHRNDPEAVIRLFESQPSLDTNRWPISEYVKALVRVDRLDESELLQTLRRGISNSVREEDSVGGLATLKNVGKPAKEGILGTVSAPIHAVALERANLKEQLWRTFRSLAVVFLLMSGLGALMEDKGIDKEVQPSLYTSTKFSDVQGVDEAKAELEEIVHYLRDPKELHALANALLQHETLTGSQIKALLAKVKSQQQPQPQTIEVQNSSQSSKPNPAASAAAASVGS